MSQKKENHNDLIGGEFLPVTRETPKQENSDSGSHYTLSSFADAQLCNL